jgi:hypothetical protein
MYPPILSLDTLPRHEPKDQVRHLREALS